MVRSTFRLFTALAGAALVAACGDIRPSVTAPDTPQLAGPPRAPRALEPGTCTDLSTLIAQATVIFGAGSPNLNSVTGKLNNLQHQISIGNTSETKVRAHDIVDFVLDKSAEGGLPGTPEQVAEFASNVYCFAGLDITVTDPSNSTLIFPTDDEQIVYSADRQAGIHFPAFPVNAPTLVTFAGIQPDAYPIPGSGPLNTKLDQYPGFYNITAQSEASEVLTQPAVVGVCAEGVVPAEVFERLRLGHDASGGFEITPEADAAFLECPEDVASAGIAGRLWQSVAKLVLPAPLHARAKARFSRGGVGGTVTEFSPFAPVDTELSFGGGVGGTVTEFTIDAAGSSLFSGTAAAATTCDPLEAPIGSPVSVNCLPFVRVNTHLGTNFQDVPINWAVTLGNGSIAPRANSTCGTFASSFDTQTSPAGRSSICWTLGDEGLNRVTATPSVGGDAPSGVSFSPAVNTFDATANPPESLEITEAPASAVAGVPFTVVVVEVDKNGDRVFGATDEVTLTLNQHSFASGATTATATAVAGVATFTGLVIERAASGYTLSASASFLQPPQALPTTAPFTVSPAAASVMTIVQGDGQSAPAGTVVPVAPTVLVADAYGNPVSGQTVQWTAALSSEGSVSPATSLTDADGEASTAWTLGDGENQLRAELQANAAVFVVFEANGSSDLALLNSCPVGGSGDPVNDPTKPFAFHIPDPGTGKSIREVQLFFSSTGRANSPTAYPIEITISRGTFDLDGSLQPVVKDTAIVMLRGNNSESKMATFAFAAGAVQGVANGGPNTQPVMMRLRVLENPDNTTITFNTGPCPPGKNCKVPKGCAATEVSSPLPYPLGTPYRQSVGINVKGH
jgi:hypothetical protein